VTPAVRVEGLSKSFGAFRALTGVNMSVAAGERRAIIGPNGAGKTTLFSIIAGQKAPTEGAVYIGEHRTSGRRPDELWALGVSRTFQRNQLFQKLTVWENVELACAAHYREWKRRAARSRMTDEIAAILERVRLLPMHAVRVNAMAYGEQRQLELALALAGRPKILLLDEPTAGMSASETQEMLAMLAGLPRDITILIVEHDMDVVFLIADRITVLNQGEVLADGTVEDIQRNEDVGAVYMGSKKP
jgi:branched-chain amino acid transport system ATP-binding protein